MITKYFKKLEACFEKYSHIIETYIVNKQIFTKEKEKYSYHYMQ